jgi:TPR repeat protein
MRTRGVLRSVLASLSLTIALPFTAAQAQNPTTPGAIPNPGTYQGSMELQRQSDERDRQQREEQQRQQQREQQQYQAYPQQRTAPGAPGAARQGGGPLRVAPRVMPDFAANKRALAAVSRHDYAAALRIVRPLAERGDMAAQYVLAAMYDRGLGFPENHPMALQWFRRSADAGYSQSMRNLGTMYRSGEAGPINYVEAYRWYTLSLTHLVPGEADAEAVHELTQDLSEVSAKMSGAQIAQAKKLARETNVPFLR